MPEQDQASSPGDPTDTPKVPEAALNQAIETYLDEAVPPAPVEDFAPLFEPSTMPPAKTPHQGASSARPAGEELDPLQPTERLWQALEQEAEKEEKEKLHKAQLHHPEPPEELPDISNL